MQIVSHLAQLAAVGVLCLIAGLVLGYWATKHIEYDKGYQHGYRFGRRAGHIDGFIKASGGLHPDDPRVEALLADYDNE